jgi:chromosome segregation ATPase
LDDTIHLCQAKIFWADVRDVEAGIAALQDAVDRSQTELDKLRFELESASGNNSDQTEELAAVEAEIVSINEQQDAVADQISAKQAAHVANTRKLDSLKSEYAQQEASLRELTGRLHKVAKEVHLQSDACSSWRGILASCYHVYGL